MSGQEESHLYSMGNGDSNFVLQNVSGDLRGISGVAWLGCRDDPSFVDFATRNSAKGKAGEKPAEEEPAAEHRFRMIYVGVLSYLFDVCKLVLPRSKIPVSSCHRKCSH